MTGYFRISLMFNCFIFLKIPTLKIVLNHSFEIKILYFKLEQVYFPVCFLRCFHLRYFLFVYLESPSFPEYLIFTSKPLDF